MEYQDSSDLVESMNHLNVKVAKARNLAAKDEGGTRDCYVKVSVGTTSLRTQVILMDLNPEWNRVFRFSEDKLIGQFLEISVWDAAVDVIGPDDFLGALSFLLRDIPSTKSSISWYKLEERPGRKIFGQGELSVAVWMGNQPEEEIQEGWATLKVYRSPTMWYLRLHIIEAQDLLLPDEGRQAELLVEVSLGTMQIKRLFVPTAKGTNPVWDKEILFLAAEPFEELLVVTVKDRVNPNKEEVIGVTRITLGYVPRRLNFPKQIPSTWYDVRSKDKGKLRGRIHLRLYFEGGYHVADEFPDFSSCTRPSAKELWQKSVGVLDLRVIGATNLVAKHNFNNLPNGRPATNAYCVAKYGSKWIRTGVISDSLNPKWHEQHTWKVYDPRTVLSVGIFDNRQSDNGVATSTAGAKDTPIGMVRIRLSALESGQFYTNSYPLLLLTDTGLQKMGELQCSVRFSMVSTVNAMQAHSQPPLPEMHHIVPIDPNELEGLRIAAVNAVAARLARCQPPLQPEVVYFMLETLTPD